MNEQKDGNKVVHVMEEVTPFHVIRAMEYRWAEQYCKGLRVMDLGCSTGSGTVLLSQSAREVVGVDISHAAIEIAKKSKVPVNVQFRLVVEGSLPFEDESFDVIVANNLIERLYNPKEMLQKIHRILKPGGILVVTTVNRTLRLYLWQKPYNQLHYQEFSPSSLKRLISKYFSDTELFGVKTSGPFFPDPTLHVNRKKFRIGVYYPIRNFLRRWVRPLFVMILPWFYPPEGSVFIKGDKRKMTSGAGDKPLDVDFETACKEVSFVKEGLKKCSEIICVSRKY